MADQMADQALIDILMERNALNPVMREQYDRMAPLGPAQPHAEAFGAGLIDPARIPSRLLNKLWGSPNTDWYERWSAEKQRRSPVAAGAGSAVLPTLIGGPLLGGSAGEVAGLAGATLPLGASGGLLEMQIRDLLGSLPERERRPQAAYPREDAY
jgi:hypothetical protein